MNARIKKVKDSITRAVLKRGNTAESKTKINIYTKKTKIRS